MYSKHVLFILFGMLYSCHCASVRQYFTRCGFGGFSCVVNKGKHEITFNCPVNVTDVTFYLWQFRAPNTIISLTIANCSLVHLAFSCTNENPPLASLTVENIENLHIVPSHLTRNPPKIFFKNIKNIEYIPPNTFSQIKYTTYKPGCTSPALDLDELSFENVTIGIIAPLAFNNLRNMQSFSWKNITVNRLQYNAVTVQLINNGNFSINESIIEISEHLAFRIVGNKATFYSNKFIELLSGAINGTFEKFIFTQNRVDNVAPLAISILVTNALITKNAFEYLNSKAFQKISPGLLQNSQMNFGKLRFIYEFSENTINFMEAGSLNPDIEAYDNVATELKFIKNSVFCSCENLGWLFVDVGHGYNTAVLKDFYETVISDEYENYCVYTSCDLPIRKAKDLLSNGTCIDSLTPENLCNVQTVPAVQVVPTTAKPIVEAAKLLRSNSSVHRLNSFIAIFIVFLLI